MPTYGFSLNAEAATYNSLTISVTTGSTGTSGETFTVAAEVSGTVISSATVTTGAEGESVNATIMGLSPSTTYTITGKINESPAATSITASTTAPSSDPRTATEAQWQDLANRVKAKSDVQITMTNTDPGEGSALAENNYVAVYGGDPIIMDYSTNEVNTGAKWIDGSAIYKKTINTGALPNNGSKDALHNISRLGAIINLEGYATNGSVWLNLPAAASNPITAHATSTAIHITTTSDRSSYTESYVTLYYTKSS